MRHREGDITVFSGQGRSCFEYYLSPQSPLEGKTEKKSVCKRLAQDSDPGDAALFALTEDLFLPSRVLVFPDFEVLSRELKDVARELISRRDDLKASVILPVQNPKKMEKTMGRDIDVVEVSEDEANKVAIRYVEGLFTERGITIERELIELITLPWSEDPHGLISEVEKLSLAFSRTESVTAEELREYSGARAELEIFRILRELITGNPSKGLVSFSCYLDTVDDNDLFRTLGALQWSIKKEYGRARTDMARGKLLKLLFLAGEIDLKIKGESRLSPRDVFQNALVSMADILGK